MKNILFLLTVLLLAGITNAQYFTEPIVKEKNHLLKGTFSGRITDAKTKAPLESVSVYITDIKTGSSTDANGEFIIKNISEGKHLIEVSHIGYSTLAEYIDISGDIKKDFVLSESVVENNAVVVTGVSGATQQKKIPFTIAVIRKQDLQQSTAANIVETLTKIGGVSTLASGPAISKPVIRGLSYNRVLTINDGVRQEGQQWGDEHGIEIDDASASKIELLKGPASLTYGSDAMAGVVNIITNVPVPNNTLLANISSNYQSNNRLGAFNASVGSNRNGFNWNFYTSNKSAQDYQNKYDDRVFNSKFNEHNVGGYAGYNGNWGYSHIVLSNFNLKAGLVEGERDADGYFIKPVAGGGETRATDDDLKSTTPLIPYQHIRHFKIATDNSFKMGKNRFAFNVGWQQNQREEFGNIDNLNESALFFDLKTITYTAQFHLAEMNGWKTSIGANGMKQQNENKGVEQLIPDYDLFDIGTYLYTQKTMDKITLSGGVRFDNRSLKAKELMEGTAVKSNAFNKSFSNFSGSIGLAAQLSNNLNVKFNIARGYRAPGITELGSNGSHEGTIRYEYGDVNLKSETSMQADASFEFSTEHLSFTMTPFYNNFSNFIFYRKLEAAAGGDSLVNVNGDDLTAFKFDQRKATMSGLEMVLDFHPHPLDWLHIQNTFSLVSGRFKEQIESTKFMPFVPAPRLVTEFRANFNKIEDHMENFYFKAELDNTFAQDNVFTAYNTETKTPGYTLFNLGIGTDVVNKKGKTVFSLNIAAMNLGDVAYQNHLSRLKYAAENMATGRQGVFNMGRNFSVKLNIPMSFTFLN